MSPLTLLWASVASFIAGFWLGGLALIWLMDRRDARHALRALRVPNGGGHRPCTTVGAPRPMRSSERD